MIISFNLRIPYNTLSIETKQGKAELESTELKRIEKVMKMNHVGIMVGDMDQAVEFTQRLQV